VVNLVAVMMTREYNLPLVTLTVSSLALFAGAAALAARRPGPPVVRKTGRIHGPVDSVLAERGSRANCRKGRALGRDATPDFLRSSVRPGDRGRAGDDGQAHAPEAGDRAVSRADAGPAGELPRRAPFEPRRAGPCQVRGLLHVRHGLPGALHRH